MLNRGMVEKRTLKTTTTVGDPGSDIKIVSEQGIREALNVVDQKKIKATYFATIASGTTSGTITKPAGAGADVDFIMDEWGTATDALVSLIENGKPTFKSPVNAAGATITTTFNTSGNYTFSDTPDPAADHALIYVYTCYIKNFVVTEALWETELLDYVADHASTHTDGTDDIQTATTSQKGIASELATDAETVTGTDTSRVTTPSNITARLAVPGEIGGTTPGTVNAKILKIQPLGTQSITAASDTIGVVSGTLNISADADYVMTSTPTITNGTNGQFLILQNTGSFQIDLQDNANLAGSTIYHGGSDGVISPGETVTLQYNSTVGGWIVQSHPNLQAQLASGTAGILDVRNTSGSTIAKGAPVYISGWNAGQARAEVGLADADDSAKMPAVGCMSASLANNKNGFVITSGVLMGTTGATLDTSGGAVEGGVWVSTTEGAVVYTRPTVDEIQRIGTVLRAHATLGSMLVVGAGRSNDIPIGFSDQVILAVKGFSYTAESELTIATGAITVTQMRHKVDTESDAASDDLVTINGGATVNMIVLRAEADARTVVIKHGTGNIWLQGKADISLDDLEDGILLFWDSTNSKWFDIGGGGGGAGDVTAAANIDANAIVVGDDGAKGVKKHASAAISAAGTLSGVNQIAFPAEAVPSADPNTLDDYEDGTWTPVLGGVTSEEGQAYTNTNGAYIKIGSFVTCTFSLTLATKGTIVGNLRLKGTPFSIGSIGTPTAIGYPGKWTLTAAHVLVIHQHSTTQFGCYEVAFTGDNPTALTATAVENGTQLKGFVTFSIL